MNTYNNPLRGMDNHRETARSMDSFSDAVKGMDSGGYGQWGIWTVTVRGADSYGEGCGQL